MADDPLRNLKALRHKIEHHSGQVLSRHARHFACRMGCDGCCQTERSVNDVEYAALEGAVAALDDGTRARLALQPKNEACSLLLDGRCSVYHERPTICRSHGMPLVMEGQIDVCPLNFTELDIAELPQEDLLSVDTVTAILTTVNMLFCHETGGDPERRREVGELLG